MTVMGTVFFFALGGTKVLFPQGEVPQKGGQEQTGHYEVVPGWPKPLTSLPGHEKWTWGAVQGVFAENPNRIYVVQRGELPALARPKNTPVPRSEEHTSELQS